MPELCSALYCQGQQQPLKLLKSTFKDFQRNVETLEAATMASFPAITIAKAASTGVPVATCRVPACCSVEPCTADLSSFIAIHKGYLHLLCRYCSDCWTPNNLNFRRNPAGKPELCWAEGAPDTPQPLHFNLSHTSTAMGKAAATMLITCLPVSVADKLAGWLTELPVLPAGIAIGANRLVGLDVEESSRLTRHDPLKLARRRFASAELARLQGGQATPSMLAGIVLTQI